MAAIPCRVERAMTDHETDPNTEAARIVGESTTNEKPLPAGLEAAWAKWAKSIKGVDERGWTLLMAAFEAEWWSRQQENR